MHSVGTIVPSSYLSVLSQADNRSRNSSVVPREILPFSIHTSYFLKPLECELILCLNQEGTMKRKLGALEKVEADL